MSVKTMPKTMPKGASKPLLVEKTELIEIEIDRSVGMVGEFLVVEMSLHKNGFIAVRRNRDIISPRFVKDEYRVLYYAVIFLDPEQFGTGRYGASTCTKAQTKARQRLFRRLNGTEMNVEKAIRWLRSALTKASLR